MTAPNVRSATVRLNAEVAKYMADMRAAGKVTDDAFAKIHSRMGLVDRDARSTQKSVDQLGKSMGDLGPKMHGLARSSTTLDKRLLSASASMDKLATSADRTHIGVTRVERDTTLLGASMGRTGNLIDRTSGRLRLFAEAALTLGPGLIPLGATGAVGIGGLAALFGTATVGALGLVAASQGVGNALKAVSKARLEPTVANLQAARDAMSRIGPEARDWVREVQHVIPLLKQLRDTGAAGFFPGLTESIDDFERLEPILTGFMRGVGQAGGKEIAEIADSLDSRRWRPFLRFLSAEVPDALHATSTLVGDLAHGAASMWRAFDPGNDQFLDWVLDVGDGFDHWASSKNGRQDIQAFLTYARENGPAVADFFESVVDAMAQLVQAAAPLGGPVLKTLTAVANVVGDLAGSDFATPALAAFAAYSALNRVLLITAAAQRRLTGSTAAAGAAGRGGLAAQGGVVGFYNKQAAGVRSFTNALLYVPTAQERALKGTEKVIAAERERQATIRRGLGTMGKAAALSAGLAVASTGLGDSIGLSNTAMGAAFGSIIPGYGTAIGAAAGLALDLAAANDDVFESLKQLDGLNFSNAGGLTGLRGALQGARDDLDTFQNDLVSVSDFSSRNNPFDSDFWDVKAQLSGTKNTIEGIFGKSDVEEAQEQFDAAAIAINQTEQAARGLAEAMGVDIFGSQTAQLQQLDRVIAKAQPGMERLGLTTEDLFTAYRNQGFNRALESTGLFSAGGNVDAFDDMTAAILKANKALSRSQRHTAILREQEQAARNAAASFLNYADAIDKGKFTLDSYLDNLDKQVTAQENFESNIENLRSRGLSKGAQQQLINQGAAGAKAAEALANGSAAAIERFNRIVRKGQETVRHFGEDTVSEMREAKTAFESLPPKVQTKIEAKGIPQTEAEVDHLVDKYELSEKQRKALITLKDLASEKIQAVLNALARADGASATTTITTELRTVRVGNDTAGGPPELRGGIADGGTVPGPRQPYGDKVLAALAPGEEVITNRHGQADRFRADRAAGRIPRYADGGTVGGRDVILTRGGNSRADEEVRRETEHRKRLNAQLKESEKAVERERRERDAVVDKMKQISSGITSSLTSQLGSNSGGDPWSSAAGGTLSGNLAIIQGDTREARRMRRLVEILEGKGFDGPALADLLSRGDINEITSYARGSRRDLRAFEQAFAERAQLVRRVSREGADAALGKRLDTANDELRQANQRLHHLEQLAHQGNQDRKEEHDKDRENERRGRGDERRDGRHHRQ